MHYQFKSYSIFASIIFFYVLLLQFTKVKSQIYQLQRDFLEKSFEVILISEFTILVQKLTIGSQVSMELAWGGLVAVAVDVGFSEM